MKGERVSYANNVRNKFMALNHCKICNIDYEGDICPKCKERAEREHSEKMNKEAVERIKHEALTPQEAARIESVFFEDDAEISLRDNKKYKIPPASLRDARRLMQLLKTVNVDAIILNFVPTGNEELDKKREDSLFEILLLAFKNYPEIDRDYLDRFVDLEIARKLIEILIGLNGLKK
jgi:hypothetical protein